MDLVSPTSTIANVAIFTCHHSRLLCLFKELARRSQTTTVTTTNTTGKQVPKQTSKTGAELAQDLERNYRLKNLATIKMVIDPPSSTTASSTSSSSSAPSPPSPTVSLTLIYEGLSKPDPERTYWIDTNKSITMTFTGENFSVLFPRIESKTTIYFVRHGEGFHNTVKGWKKLTAPRKLLTDAFLVSSDGISDASRAIQKDIIKDYPQGLLTPLALFSSPLRRCIETLYLILNKMLPGRTSSSSSSSSVQQLIQIAEKIIIIPCSGEVNSSKTCDKGLWPSALENKSICTALRCTTYEDLFKGVVIRNPTNNEVIIPETSDVVDLIFKNENLQKVNIDWSMFFNVGKEECKTKMLTQFIGDAFTEEQTPRRGNKTQFLQKEVKKYVKDLPVLLSKQIKQQLNVTEDKITFPEKDKKGETLKPEDIYDMVWNAIPSNPNPITNEENNFVEWMKCDKKKHCDSAALHYLWRIERESTIYMLRILNMGYISKKDDTSRPLIINFDLSHGSLTSTSTVRNATLTGIWSEDYHNVKLALATTEGAITFVLASGPTGAGKTFMGEKICEKLDLPPMISIDGGIYRDCSIVYQIIKHVLKMKGWAGMRNLVFTTTLEKIHSVPRLLRISWTKFFEGIFDTEKVKNLVSQYLHNQKRLYRINFPIYVPDTLSFTPSMNDYKDFLELTGYSGKNTDRMNIVNAVIYQHWEGGEKCPLKPQNKCVGCLASGQEREIREGKKYPDNPDSYNKGVENSLAVLFDESNEFTTRIFIHNTGSPDPSKESLWYQWNNNPGIVSPNLQL